MGSHHSDFSYSRLHFILRKTDIRLQEIEASIVILFVALEPRFFSHLLIFAGGVFWRRHPVIDNDIENHHTLHPWVDFRQGLRG